MKRDLFVLIAALLLSTLLSCNKESNPNCGPNKTFKMYLLSDSVVDTSTGFYYSYREGNNRVFQWSEVVSDVCPEEHVKVEFRVALKIAFNANSLSTRARVSYGILSERQFSMSLDGLDSKGNGEVGLKQAYGTDPAEFIPVLEVFFPTKGSYTADKAFLQQEVIAVEIIAKYLDYKY